MAPKVMASEMMNSHIVNFRDGIAYEAGSIRAAPCAWMAWSDSLTISSLPSRSESGRNYEEQVQPQNAHKMPVNRRTLEQTPARTAEARRNLANEIDQGDETANDMQSVHDGEYVEKR